MVVRNFLCVFVTIFLSKRGRTRYWVLRILRADMDIDVREDVPDTVIQSGAILKNCDLTYQYGALNNI